MMTSPAQLKTMTMTTRSRWMDAYCNVTEKVMIYRSNNAQPLAGVLKLPKRQQTVLLPFVRTRLWE